MKSLVPTIPIRYEARRLDNGITDAMLASVQGAIDADDDLANPSLEFLLGVEVRHLSAAVFNTRTRTTLKSMILRAASFQARIKMRSHLIHGRLFGGSRQGGRIQIQAFFRE